MRRFFTFGPAIVVLLAAAVTLLAAPTMILRMNTARIAASVSMATATLDSGTELERINAENRAVVDAAMPGVVHINSASRRSGSTGAGWLWDDLGHVITNAHVVQNGRRISVQLYDGRVVDARVVASDPFTDLAVLKIDTAEGLLPARRAAAGSLRVGDRVFVVGSPFNIRFSVSEGVVSGLGRSEAAPMLGMLNGYTNYIQTDAAMNPGNSGGPLVDINGRIVGMCSAIANQTDRPVANADDERLDAVQDPAARDILRTLIDENLSPFRGQSAGIGFAIPLETLESVVPQLIESDVVIRGYLGVMLATNFGARSAYTGEGVIVEQLPAGQPASRSSLRIDDVILRVNDTLTPDINVLRSAISVHNPGETVNLHVWRSGSEVSVPVTLGAAYMSDSGQLVYVPDSAQKSMAEIRSWIEADRREDAAN